MNRALLTKALRDIPPIQETPQRERLSGSTCVRSTQTQGCGIAPQKIFPGPPRKENGPGPPRAGIHPREKSMVACNKVTQSFAGFRVQQGFKQRHAGFQRSECRFKH